MKTSSIHNRTLLHKALLVFMFITFSLVGFGVGASEAEAQTCTMEANKAVTGGVNRTLIDSSNWSGVQPPQPNIQQGICGAACEAAGAQVCEMFIFHLESETDCSGHGLCQPGDSEYGFYECYSYDSGTIEDRNPSASLGGGCGAEECYEIWTYEDWWATTCSASNPQCSDGADNDGDGGTDIGDAQCIGYYGYDALDDNELCNWEEDGGASFQDTGPCQPDVDETDPTKPEYIECNPAAEAAGDRAGIIEYSSCGGSPIVVDQIDFECVCGGPPANNVPNADAGPNRNIIQPTSGSDADGTGSDDPDGFIDTYAWTQVGVVPSVATINFADTPTPTFTNLTSLGTYTFRLTVTDDDGDTDSDTMTVTVSPAPPVCNWDPVNGGDAQGDFATCADAVIANGYPSDDFDETDPGDPNYIACNPAAELAGTNAREYTCEEPGGPVTTQEDWTDYDCVCGANVGPTTPTITGPAATSTGTTFYTFSGSVDPDGDTIQYEVDWGEGGANQFYPAAATLPSGGSQVQSNDYGTAGNYTIRARAIDSNGNLSGWTSKSINISDPVTCDWTERNRQGEQDGCCGCASFDETDPADPAYVGACTIGNVGATAESEFYWGGAPPCEELQINYECQCSSNAANILTFTANPGTITLGNSTNLSWTADGDITNCSLENVTDAIFISGGYNRNDNQVDTPLSTGNKTYQLTCYSAAGDDIATTNVQVDPPVGAYFIATSPTNIDVGDSVDFEFRCPVNVSGNTVTDMEIMNLPGEVPPFYVPTGGASIDTHTHTFNVAGTFNIHGECIGTIPAIETQYVDSVSVTVNPAGGGGDCWDRQIYGELPGDPQYQFCSAAELVSLPSCASLGYPPNGPADGTPYVGGPTKCCGVSAVGNSGAEAGAWPFCAGGAQAPTATIEVSINNGAWTGADQTIDIGDTVEIRWDSTNSASCAGTNVVTGGATDAMPNGVAVATPGAGSSLTYSVTCDNGSGSTDTDSVTVTTNNPPDLSGSIIAGTLTPEVDGFGNLTGDYSEVEVILTLDENNNVAITDAFVVRVELDINGFGGAVDAFWERPYPVGVAANYSDTFSYTFDTAALPVPVPATPDSVVRVFIDYDAVDPDGNITESNELNNTDSDTLPGGLPAISMDLNIIPSDFVRGGQTAELNWDTNAVFPMDCTLEGPALTPVSFNPNTDGPTGSATTGPINAKSIYQLSCTELVMPPPNTTYTETTSIETTGTVQEI